MRRSVVFPHPDGPTMLMSSPLSMSMLKSSMATVDESSVTYVLLRFLMVMRALSLSAPHSSWGSNLTSSPEPVPFCVWISSVIPSPSF